MEVTRKTGPSDPAHNPEVRTRRSATSDRLWKRGSQGLLAEIDAWEPSADANRPMKLLLRASSRWGGFAKIVSDYLAQMEDVRAARRSLRYPRAQAPLVLRAPSHPPVRMGLLHPFTDVDAFIGKLLGGPPPRHPRFVREPLIVPVEFEPQGHEPRVDRSELPKEKWLGDEVARRRILNWLIWGAGRRLAQIDPVLAEIAKAYFGGAVQPGEREERPVVTEAMQVARRDPHWRGPASLRNFRPVHVLDEHPLWRRAVVLYWHPIPRAALAGRIRFLHRTAIAPWSRSTDPGLRLQRFLAYQARLVDPPVPMREVSDRLRLHGGVDDDEGQLRRRLERWSTEAAAWARHAPQVG